MFSRKNIHYSNNWFIAKPMYACVSVRSGIICSRQWWIWTWPHLKNHCRHTGHGQEKSCWWQDSVYLMTGKGGCTMHWWMVTVQRSIRYASHTDAWFFKKTVEEMCHSGISCLLTKEIRPMRLMVSKSTCSSGAIPLGGTKSFNGGWWVLSHHVSMLCFWWYIIKWKVS